MWIGGGPPFFSPAPSSADGVLPDDSSAGSLDGALEDSLEESSGASLDELAEDVSDDFPLVPDWSSETSGRMSATLAASSAGSVTGSATGFVAGIRALSSSARAVGAPRATTAVVIPTAVIPIMGLINLPPISVKTTRAR
ncbi:hypothetical protein NOGI109294_10965 [Nocardiopsis gilva]